MTPQDMAPRIVRHGGLIPGKTAFIAPDVPAGPTWKS